MKRLLFFILAFTVAAFSAQAGYVSSQTGIATELFSSQNAVSDNHDFQVLVKVALPQNTHIYWNNPGDTGVATSVSLIVDGQSAKLVEQSMPKHFFVHNIIHQFAYDKEAYWLFDVTPPADKKPGDIITLQADIAWMACNEECVTESVSEIIRLPFEYSGATHSPQVWEKERLAAQKTFPSKNVNGFYEIKGNQLGIHIPGITNGIDSLYFIPAQNNLIFNESRQNYKITPQGLYLDLPLSGIAAPEKQLSGVLLTDTGDLNVSLQNGNVTLPQTEQEGLFGILLAAFAGGLILNLMPCIFPVLFIKTLSLMQTVQHPKQRVTESLMYFIGVVISFLMIASLLLILRTGGENIGWGFQLQSPIFVAVMFVIFFFIALLLLDISSFNLPILNRLASIHSKNGSINAFLTGLFAVLIASPCSAPFMGIAIGYSMTQPLYIYYPVFLTLAIGYALPFTFIGMFPQTLGKLLPKPGKWMVTLKKLFAIPVLLTCAWLAWIFYNQTNTSQTVSDNYLTYSEQTFQKLQKEQRPVLLIFTAKWCLTCLVNEKLAFESTDVLSLLKEKNIQVLKADWTNKDEAITQALAAYGRNSVPLYVYYDGTGKEYKILPQILTPSVIINELQN